jgi:hypothetical protein
MTLTLEAAVRKINRIKRQSRTLARLIKIVRAFVLGAMTTSIWGMVRQGEESEQLYLGFFVFLISIASSSKKVNDVKVYPGSLALSLEMKHGTDHKKALSTSNPSTSLPDDWQEAVRKEISETKAFERSRLFALAAGCLIPLLITVITIPNAAPSFQLMFKEVSNVVALLNRGATLKVLQGSSEGSQQKAYQLSTTSPAKIELLAQNLVEVNVTGGGFENASPVVELRNWTDETKEDPAAQTPAKEGEPVKEQLAPKNDSIFQTFQMTPVRDPGSAADEPARYTISFAINERVKIFIPAIDKNRHVAEVTVKQLPIPKVTLSMLSDPEDPWPDDQPLTLQINVEAENPLQIVRLIIKSGSRVSNELVANVLNEDMKDLSTEYRLILEPYVESDIAQVEIIAEATDKAIPNPLTGQSQPLRINTASAYGRYRQTLQTLRQIKELVDKAQSSQEAKLPEEAQELADLANRQSEKSPFFDGLDRVQISKFQGEVSLINQDAKMEQMLELSQNINDFLFEHEILDDRERDRDFFVAARSLSRLIEIEKAKRPVALASVTQRANEFLKDRIERWKLRMARVNPDLAPEMWPKVRDQNPFIKSITEIQKAEKSTVSENEVKADQLEILSKTVVEYRYWIEALEAAEDKSREAEEKQRQEGLASARDVIKELQKRQGEISGELDKADQKTKEQLEEQWPSTRMKQNTNAKETKRLESQMRSLSPTAGERIEAAAKAMEMTNEAGDGANYQMAESASDMAGRMLRQADSAAQQSQQKKRDRGRRRRVTGDTYYGQSVVGGDVEMKREYQVDRRYREDILEEVQTSSYDEDNRILLENYLRQVVR